MGIFSWSPSLEIGIESIDSQHRHLVKLISELFESMRVGLGYKQVDVTIKELKEYTKYHFEEEEKLMREINYPHYAEHLEAHQYFVEQIVDFSNRHKEEEIGISLHLLDFLKNWLVNHITTVDKEIPNYIDENKKNEV